MENDFLLIHKSIVPYCYMQVIRAKELLEHNRKTISEVCKELDISRATFYKYKDKIFETVEKYEKKAIISVKTENVKGVLSSVLNRIANLGGNVLTINQDMPIKNTAFINITLDAKELKIDLTQLSADIKKIDKVKDISVLAFE